MLCGNLRTVFGLPVHVLRALDRDDINDELLEHLADLYSRNPSLLQFDRISRAMCMFYGDLEIRCRAGAGGAAERAGRSRRCLPVQYRLRGLDRTFSEAEIFRILKYLYKGTESWEYLRDYYLACETLGEGEFPYGLLPRIPVGEAHDRVVERVRMKKGDPEAALFSEVVRSQKYISLTTNEIDEDKETFQDDMYLVIAPGWESDLFRESESMHNCVKIYASRVAGRHTSIYFLRKKEAPEKSFATIEVRNGMLVQAKGFANRRLQKDAQDFIRKWCLVKHLKIRTHDIGS